VDEAIRIRMEGEGNMASEMTVGGCERCGSNRGIEYASRQFLCRECREKLAMEIERITLRILHLAQVKRAEIEGMKAQR
jgi:uncharacterized protein YlaI